jgi:phosphatidylinositol alpha-1,6-mannosyltransferase
MNKWPRIAIVTENFPPCAGGGIAEWAYGVADCLSRTGCDVIVYTKWKKKIDAAIHQDKQFKIHVMRGRDWRKFRYWYTLFYLWGFLRRNPDGIIVATTWELGLAALSLKRYYPNLKLVSIAIGIEVTRLKAGRSLENFRKTIEAANLVIAISRFTQDAIADLMGRQNPNHVVFIPCAVDINRFHPVDDYQSLLKKWDLSPDCKIITTLARVIERKGHDTVIRGLPEIVAEFPKTKYIIAGPWKEPYYQKLSDLIKKLKMEKHVIFTGFVDEHDLCKYYSMSDVYVMVSRTIEERGDTEGFGITFLEANACECPVIGSNAGGIPDAIEDGLSGFLIQPDDVSSLSQKIMTVFRNPDLARKMGIDGRKRVINHFTWEKITRDILDELKKRIR